MEPSATAVDVDEVQRYLLERDRSGPEMNSEPTEIQRFYSGTSIFITGATGFMGKVLIEKLLRCCPGVERIFIMVRPKKGKPVSERVADLISSRCFDRIRKENPDFHLKIHAIAGDIGAEGLGLSDLDRHLLERQVHLVFHVAATIRFDQHLQIAILQNVRGTREILNLCRGIDNLQGVVHVSTAYSNCTVSVLEEQLYDPPFSSDHLIKLAETHDLFTLDCLSHKIIGKWPNTYTFTKAISEDAVKTFGKGLPVGVFRPAIVMWTHKEPVPGWIDNLYGPVGIRLGITSGVLRVLNVRDGSNSNMVPCDMAISALLTFAWDLQKRSRDGILVANYSMSPTNTINWQRSIELTNGQCRNYPTVKSVWMPELLKAENAALFGVAELFLHILPALLIDLFLLLTMRKPLMLSVSIKMRKFITVLLYFAVRQWVFKTDYIRNLWQRLGNRDKEMFNFDMDSLDWYRYNRETFMGVREYILDDPPETLPEAKKKCERLFVLHNAVKFTVVCGVVWLWFQLYPLLILLLWKIVEKIVSPSIKIVSSLWLNA